MEEYLAKAVQGGECEYAGGIIMEPSTGNVLAMASYPTYNLNEPFTPNTKESIDNWDNMSKNEKTTFHHHPSCPSSVPFCLFLKGQFEGTQRRFKDRYDQRR